MNKPFFTVSLVALRIAMGWLLFYAGVTKIINPAWSAAGYLKGAKTFTGIYGWFASPGNIGWVNFLNEWGLTLIGLALIFGILTRYASWAGVLLMVLYYFPILDFPYAGEHSYIIDEHIIYALALILFAAADAGKYWGLDAFLPRFFRATTPTQQ